MPNRNNITAPFSLIAYGRSGTSLLFKAFAARSDMDCTGETGNLIFTSWRALEQISGITRYGKIEEMDYRVDGAKLVRGAFLNIFPSDKPLWMQKPIGTPKMMWDFPSGDLDGFIDWYWMVFNSAFPKARKFSIIRHPNDVYLSAKKFWNFADDAIFRTQWIMNRILMHRHAGLRHLMTFEGLIAAPEDGMKALMDSLELTFDPNMMDAFAQLHVPSEDVHVARGGDLEKKQKANFSHQAKWDAIDDFPHKEKAIESYEQLKQMHGLS